MMDVCKLCACAVGWQCTRVQKCLHVCVCVCVWVQVNECMHAYVCARHRWREYMQVHIFYMYLLMSLSNKLPCVLVSLYPCLCMRNKSLITDVSLTFSHLSSPVFGIVSALIFLLATTVTPAALTMKDHFPPGSFAGVNATNTG